MSKHTVTVPTFAQKKKRGEKITMLTAYDALFAKLMDDAGIDSVLVGDSLGMVVQGQDSTLPVTVDEIIYHTRAVKRSVKRALIVADMPFMSYQISDEKALENAARIMKEGGADAVKIEGGMTYETAIIRMVEAGIPVMGHVGLGPQSTKALGGHKVQGKTAEQIEEIMEDAIAVQEAGAFSVVVEAVPWPVAQRITEQLSIPTIGIGAGPHCDGQVMVYADMLGLFTAFQPHFVRRFAHLADDATRAFKNYIKAVEESNFPTLDESYSIDEKILKEAEESDSYRNME